METVLRTLLASVAIIAMVATEVAESLTPEKISLSQGEDQPPPPNLTPPHNPPFLSSFFRE